MLLFLGFQVLSVLLILGNNVYQIFQVNLRQSLFPEPKGGELLKWGRSGYFSLTWGSSTGKLYKTLLMRWIFATPVCGNRDQSHPCQLEETPGPPYHLAQCTWTNMWSVLTSSCDILGSKGFSLSGRHCWNFWLVLGTQIRAVGYFLTWSFPAPITKYELYPLMLQSKTLTIWLS